MRIITIQYTDGYKYEKPILFTVPDLTDRQIKERLQAAVLEYRKELGYENPKDAKQNGWGFGTLLPEVPLRILKKYGIGILHADILTLDFDYGSSPKNWVL